MLFSQIVEESDYLNNQISIASKQLKDCPPGKLIVAQNGSSFKWYIRNGESFEYLPKSEFRLAHILAKKKYLEERLTAMRTEQSAIDFYLRHYQNEIEKVDKKFASDKYAKLLNFSSNAKSPFIDKSACISCNSNTNKITNIPEDTTISPNGNTNNSINLLPNSYYKIQQDIIRTNPSIISIEDPYKWSNDNYPTNAYNADKKVFSTLSGHNVRSKSEVLIADALYRHGLCFRYEDELIIDGESKYPDFTLINPYTAQLIYWEHFGMMDNESYRNRNLSKLGEYTLHGLIPGHNLITTFETIDHPLDSYHVERTISSLVYPLSES